MVEIRFTQHGNDRALEFGYTVEDVRAVLRDPVDVRAGATEDITVYAGLSGGRWIRIVIAEDVARERLWIVSIHPTRRYQRRTS